MTKSTVVPFELPSEFSPDPLTEVIQNGAQALLRTAIQAEVSAFIRSTRSCWMKRPRSAGRAAAG